MSFDDYTVTISWNTESGSTYYSTFEVMAYSKEEAEDLAFSEWSDLDYDHVSTLNYETELTPELEW